MYDHTLLSKVQLKSVAAFKEHFLSICYYTSILFQCKFVDKTTFREHSCHIHIPTVSARYSHRRRRTDLPTVFTDVIGYHRVAASYDSCAWYEYRYINIFIELVFISKIRKFYLIRLIIFCFLK